MKALLFLTALLALVAAVPPYYSWTVTNGLAIRQISCDFTPPTEVLDCQFDEAVPKLGYSMDSLKWSNGQTFALAQPEDEPNMILLQLSSNPTKVYDLAKNLKDFLKSFKSSIPMTITVKDNKVVSSTGAQLNSRPSALKGSAKFLKVITADKKAIAIKKP